MLTFDPSIRPTAEAEGSVRNTGGTVQKGLECLQMFGNEVVLLSPWLKFKAGR